MQPFVPPEQADRAVATEGAESRRRGVLVVVMQLNNSTSFSLMFWPSCAIGIIASLWFKSWVPISIAVLFLLIMYIALIPLQARRVAKTGVLPEYQAAYKRPYYKDPQFKQQVDAVKKHLQKAPGK